MSILLTRLSEIMDIPLVRKNLLYDEAKSKLNGTWVIINDKLEHINEIIHDLNYVYTKKEEKIPVQTIDLFLPNSGVYITKNGCLVIIEKRIGAFYKKSFSLNSYHLIVLNNKEINMEELHKNVPITFFISKNFLYKEGKSIGTIQEGCIKFKNLLYVQEVMDYVRINGKIREVSNV